MRDRLVEHGTLIDETFANNSNDRFGAGVCPRHIDALTLSSYSGPTPPSWRGAEYWPYRYAAT